MINFEFTRPTDENPEGKIRVSVDTSHYNFFNDKQFPLHLMHKTLMGEIAWSTEMYPGWFSEYLMNTHTTVEIIDSLGNKLLDWKWDPFIHGDFAHQFFETWATNNIGSNGIAIGTHNGMQGEWVGPVNKGLLKATLVEASEIQFNDLLKYYRNKSWITCIKTLITTDGKDVVFYEGGAGFTNSISETIIRNYVDEQYITSNLKPSISLNDLIVECSERGKIEWIHLDVEGYDGDLIYSINEDYLPKILIFESLHMSEFYFNQLKSYLQNKSYKVIKFGWNTLCVKE